MTTEEALKYVDGIKMVFASDHAAKHLAAEVRRMREDIATVKARRCIHCGCLVNVGGQCDNCRELNRLRELQRREPRCPVCGDKVCRPNFKMNNPAAKNDGPDPEIASQSKGD